MNIQPLSSGQQNDENEGEFASHPTKKLKLTESKSIEFPSQKDIKDERAQDDKMGEKTDSHKNLANFNIVNIDKQDPSHYKEYKRIKYKNVIYNLNDILMIRNCEDANNDFIGILRKIIKVVIENNVNILIEVQW